MLVQIERYIYIIEFKMDSADEALSQIVEKRYYEPFLSEEKEILLVGISFSRSDRNISQVTYAQLPPGERMTPPFSIDNLNICTLDFPAKDRERSGE